MSSVLFLSSAYAEAVAAAERALQLAAELGLPEPVRALGYRGNARAFLGERQGLEDMRRALALAIEQGRAVRRPSCTTTSRSPPGRTRDRKPPSPPAETGSTSANGAVSPSSHSRSRA